MSSTWAQTRGIQVSHHHFAASLLSKGLAQGRGLAGEQHIQLWGGILKHRNPLWQFGSQNHLCFSVTIAGVGWFLQDSWGCCLGHPGRIPREGKPAAECLSGCLEGSVMQGMSTVEVSDLD